MTTTHLPPICIPLFLNPTVYDLVGYRQWDLVTGTPTLPGAEANATISEKSRSSEVGGAEEAPCDGGEGTARLFFRLCCTLPPPPLTTKIPKPAPSPIIT